MRILCVANEIPLPANSGGRVDVWRRFQALRAAGHQLSLLCWFDAGRTDAPSPAELAELAEKCDGLVVLPITRSVGELARRALHLWRWPSHVAARWVTSRRAGLEGWAKSLAPDLVLLDGLYGGAVAIDLARGLGKPMVYRSHNIEHRYMVQQGRCERRVVRRFGLAVNSIGLERFERMVIGCAKRVMDISPDDAKLWRDLGFPHVLWVPTLVDPSFAEHVARVSADKGNDVLLFGNLNTPNNVEALRWFVQSVLPRLPEPALRIAVAGSRPTPEVRALLRGDPRLTLIEDPTDMATVLGTSRVVVNSMRVSSGVNLKSVEMVFSNAALVSTSHGVSGMPPSARSCFVVADTPAEFAAATMHALAGAKPDVEARDAARRAFSTSVLLATIAEFEPQHRRIEEGAL